MFADRTTATGIGAVGACLIAPVIQKGDWQMRVAPLAIILFAVALPVVAKGLCTGTRECPWTAIEEQAQQNWSNCVLQSAGVQARHTDDPNAAMEAALASCLSEEEALFSLVQTESNFTPAEAAQIRVVMKAAMKAKTLDLMRNGPAAEKCRRALKEGGTC
jgi:hypothetical protein